MYLDANNLYGCGMSQKLLVNGFKWIKKLSKFKERSSAKDFIKIIMKIVTRDIFSKQMLNIQKFI